jgi:hypothetical protein
MYFTVPEGLIHDCLASWWEEHLVEMAAHLMVDRKQRTRERNWEAGITLKVPLVFYFL